MSNTVNFNDGLAYERFMGRWSRAMGDSFLNWLAPPRGASWLDVGCGTGAFTQLVVENCSPSSVIGVDPAPAQVEYACKHPERRGADFRVADAQMLPFPDHTFDVVVSALVINFIPNRPRALAEMSRVVRPGGIISAYVWDFAGGRSANWPFARSMRAIGLETATFPGAADSSIDALTSLFAQAGFKEIAARPIDAAITFSGFDEFWNAQTPRFAPNGVAVAALSESDRAKLILAIRRALPCNADGSITYVARTNAIKARAMN